jgi:glycosyltransferase involved in cell wall biosynthesis
VKRPTNARPRVAVVYHFFPHYREAVNRALHEEGTCEWTFCGDVADFTESGIKPAEFAADMRFRRMPCHAIRGSVMWQSGLLSLAVSREFDALILLGVPKYLAMWPAAILGRLTGKRVMFWTHGWTYRPTGPLRYVRRWFFKMASSVLTYGRWAKALAIEEGFAPARVHVIGNSLDFEGQTRAYAGLSAARAGEVRTALFGEADTPVVAWTGRLAKIKRLEMIFEALAILATRGVRANVVMIGDGPERARLERLASEHGIRTHFEGACYDEARISELLYAANATVSPGHLGLTALHSMAFGTPVVTHGDPERQAPEFEAIVPGKTGSLFEFGSVTGLADALEPWLRSDRVSDETRGACRRMVERFWSPEFQVRAILRAVRGLEADDLWFMREASRATPAEALGDGRAGSSHGVRNVR